MKLASRSSDEWEPSKASASFASAVASIDETEIVQQARRVWDKLDASVSSVLLAAWVMLVLSLLLKDPAMLGLFSAAAVAYVLDRAAVPQYRVLLEVSEFLLVLGTATLSDGWTVPRTSVFGFLALSLAAGRSLLDLWKRERLVGRWDNHSMCAAFADVGDSTLRLSLWSTMLHKGSGVPASMLLLFTVPHVLAAWLQRSRDTPPSLAMELILSTTPSTLLMYLAVVNRNHPSWGGMAPPLMMGLAAVALTTCSALRLRSIIRTLVRKRRGKKNNSSPATPAVAPAADGAGEEQQQEQQQQEEDYDNMWHIHGQAYDLTEFAKVHPGGDLAVALGRGRDCTALFESYHPFSKRHRATLAKYAISPEGKEAALSPPVDEFYEILKKRVRAALLDAGVRRDSKADWKRWAWYLGVVASLLWGYRLYVGGFAGGAILFPLAAWLMGGLGHDGSHFAVSTTPWVNRVSTIFGMCFIASPQMWYHQHVYAHHSHTNEHDNDPDLHHFHTLRTHNEMPHKQVHRKQFDWIWVFVWYTLTTFGDALWVPIMSIQSGYVANTTPIPNHGDASLGGVPFARATLFHNALYAIFVFSPVFTLGWAGLVSSLMHIVITGFLFGFFSQINHLNEASLEGSALENEDGSPKSWAARQCESSTNWATGSWFWTHMSNHLNHQIEHHLFPGVNHGHLGLVSKVVRQACEEHGVNYQSKATFWEALQNTIRFYRRLSFPDYDRKQD